LSEAKPIVASGIKSDGFRKGSTHPTGYSAYGGGDYRDNSEQMQGCEIDFPYFRGGIAKVSR